MKQNLDKSEKKYGRTEPNLHSNTEIGNAAFDYATFKRHSTLFRNNFNKKNFRWIHSYFLKSKKVAWLSSIVLLFQFCLTENPNGDFLFFSLFQDEKSGLSVDPPPIVGPPAANHALSITPSTTTGVVGSTLQFRAYHTVNSGTPIEITEDVDWVSSDTSILSFANTPGSKGIADLLTPGSSTVTIQPNATLAAVLPASVLGINKIMTLSPAPDTAAPTLTAFTPANGSSGFSPLTFQLDFTFSEPMNTSVTPTITLEDRTGVSTFVPFTSLSYTHTWNSNTSLSVVLGPFPENFAFRWTLSNTGLTDVAGNALAASQQATSATTAESVNIPLTDTGQVGCWDASGTVLGTCAGGMDGEVTGVSPTASMVGPSVNMTYPSDPTTFHGLTNLRWTTCTHGQVWNGANNCQGTGSSPIYGGITASWDQAIQTCRSYNARNSGAGYGGRQGWRLPTIREMQSILDYAYTSNRIIHPTYFPNMIKSQNYWSSTTRSKPSNKDTALKINTYAGKIQNATKSTNTLYFYCVTNQ
ncbi:DUF1566 domain-containing protein [Leptospira sp. WS92.C1]